MTPRTGTYVGRFAPSPTGPLHFGSLLAALASYSEARANRGKWLLRIEDIDPPREQAGADQLIVAALETYGFEWDGPVLYQSRSTEYHETLVESLLDKGLAYPCSCSRRDLADVRRGPMGPIYPGTCRTGARSEDVAIRLRTNNDLIEFNDRLQGSFGQRLETESGDFVIRRRDGLIAYHLAVVADDAHQGVTEIVRGIDLLDSTPRQIHVQRVLDLPTPDYAHIPVAVNEQRQKLSKLTGAPPIDTARPALALFAALCALRQDPPASLRHASVGEIWSWTHANWSILPLIGQETIPIGQ